MRGIETIMAEGRRKSINLMLEPGDAVLPCPFCGATGPDFWNTHTAYYTVECQDCGARVSGKAFGVNRTSDTLTMAHHRRAKRSALAPWNRRTP